MYNQIGEVCWGVGGWRIYKNKDKNQLHSSWNPQNPK